MIEFAFNLLLGVASEARVLTREFADIRFLKEASLVEELPDRWLVHFAPRTDGELPTVALFPSRMAEVDWVVAQLHKFIHEEGIRSEDILLVAENPNRFLPLLLERLRKQLPSVRRLVTPWKPAPNPERDIYIFQEGALTLTSVKGAKGYDCPIVFLLGADLFPASVEGRASFYVAATRAKMRLLVTGSRIAGTLAEEAERVATLLSMPPAPTPDNPLPLTSSTDLNPLPKAQGEGISLDRGRLVGRIVADTVLSLSRYWKSAKKQSKKGANQDGSSHCGNPVR